MVRLLGIESVCTLEDTEKEASIPAYFFNAER
jgi:hypothetical protein